MPETEQLPKYGAVRKKGASLMLNEQKGKVNVVFKFLNRKFKGVRWMP